MTERNKLFSGALFVLVAAQFCFGVFSSIRITARPRKFLGPSFIPVRICICL